MPGFAFDNAVRSASDFTLSAAFTTSTCVMVKSCVIGSKRVDRIERQGLEQELIVDERLARNDADGVAVGRGLRAGAGADVERPARPVLDHDRLAEALVQLLGERAHEDVAGAAGARRGDDADRARGIVLRRSGQRDV